MDPTSKEGIYTKLNRHGKKVFVARFKINGKTYRPVLGTAPQMNLRDAVARREELIKEKKGYRVHSGKTIDILFEEYIAYRKSDLSESWYYNIERNYNKHLKNIIGNQYPNNVSVEDIQYQIDYLLGKKEEKPKKILKPSTAKQLKDCVSGLYTYLIDQGRKEALKESRVKTDVVTEKVTINIGHMLEIPKFDNKVYFTISEVQAEKLYNTIINYEELTWRAYFIFLLHGRRKMEVAAMRWEWIDFNHMEYMLPSDKTKGKKTISAPMTLFLKEALERVGIKNEGYIFQGTSEKGHIGSTGIDYQWRKLRGVAGMHKMRLHDIRHLIGYLAINNGHSLEQIGYVLGHSSILTTKRYSNLKSKGAASVLNTVFDQLSGNSNPR
ncbi:MAG TPA: site-specific integrase [Sulfurovum sp.]|nr:site-specific integrase [Sulfurovum sp.]